MEVDGRCLTNGWSIVAAAPTNSQLAGVLAGFVFTAMIILFARSGPANTKTLGLFSASFVVLAFDSYLFSFIAGGSSDPLCRRVWTESMAARGMLAVGATALISGIAWLLANYTQAENLSAQTTEHPGARAVNLQKLAQFIVLGVAAGVCLILGMTTLNFMYVALGRRPPAHWVLLAYAIPLAVVTMAAILNRTRTVRLQKNSEADSNAWPTKSLSVAVFGTASYGIVGPVFVGAIVNIGDAPFAAPSWILTTCAISIGFLTPIILIVLLVYAVPRTPPPSRRIGAQSSGKTTSTPSPSDNAQDLPHSALPGTVAIPLPAAPSPPD
ncbi:hypothetical protein [Amycolatopsis sp. CA-126428]|uniref:hypothetical protein n=1 Tax=Amycolatopsis sp. CA-126428 TaxID=2073158 RepID=UPI000CD02EA5|nr:hypothetical protein [Amycolatopsis sp. CA-126428]